MGSVAWNAGAAAGAASGQLLALLPLIGLDTLSVRTGPESTVTAWPAAAATHATANTPVQSRLAILAASLAQTPVFSAVLSRKCSDAHVTSAPAICFFFISTSSGETRGQTLEFHILSIDFCRALRNTERDRVVLQFVLEGISFTTSAPAVNAEGGRALIVATKKRTSTRPKQTDFEIGNNRHDLSRRDKNQSTRHWPVSARAHKA